MVIYLNLMSWIRGYCLPVLAALFMPMIASVAYIDGNCVCDGNSAQVQLACTAYVWYVETNQCFYLCLMSLIAITFISSNRTFFW